MVDKAEIKINPETNFELYTRLKALELAVDWARIQSTTSTAPQVVEAATDFADFLEGKPPLIRVVGDTATMAVEAQPGEVEGG